MLRVALLLVFASSNVGILFKAYLLGIGTGILVSPVPAKIEAVRDNLSAFGAYLGCQGELGCMAGQGGPSEEFGVFLQLRLHVPRAYCEPDDVILVVLIYA